MYKCNRRLYYKTVYHKVRNVVQLPLQSVSLNSLYFYFCSAPPGLLIGHYTQLCWAQAWRIGCGKIYYQREGQRFGEQLFICNYGIAGNLIKSEMYKIGKPCTQCPEGTTCSNRYSKVLYNRHLLNQGFYWTLF